MEISNTGICLYLGRMYENGAERSGYVHRLVCENGEWHDANADPDDSGLALVYFYH